MVPTRRLALALLAAALLPAWGEPAAGSAGGAEAVVAAIYRRASAGTGDSGGQFLWVEKKDRRAAFTIRTADLWDKAEAATPTGEMGPIEFDPVTASQDPQVTGFTLREESGGPDRATVAATLKGPGYERPDNVVRYDLVNAGGRWRIDDIRGSVHGTPWSVRAILAASLKP